jgi:hypothetical protein
MTWPDLTQDVEDCLFMFPPLKIAESDRVSLVHDLCGSDGFIYNSKILIGIYKHCVPFRDVYAT